jgi:hypothetical protein
VPGRDRRAPDRGIELVESARQRLERPVGQLPNRPQRVIRRDPLLGGDVTEDVAELMLLAKASHNRYGGIALVRR